MKIIRAAILVLCGLLAGLSRVRAEDPPPSTAGLPAEHFATASGAQLARELVPAATRLAAVQELARRANQAGRKDGTRLVVEDDAEPETVVCPQADGNGPLYVVLYKFLPVRHALGEEGYPVARPTELFPPEPTPGNGPAAPVHPPLERRSELAIAVFNARGEEITPFGGDNVLSDGVLADFTGDGRIARADDINFGVEGVKEASVLVVTAVQAPAARPLLAVLYNWGEQGGWGYEFAPRADGPGIEVRLGPVVDDEGRRIDPKVTYHWDTGRRAFVGPAGGKAGDHFLVLGTDKDLFDAVAALKGRLPFFTVATPPKPPPAPVAATPTPAPAPSAPATKPLVPVAFLDGLSDEAILRFFGEGRNPAAEARRRQPTSIALPTDFWTRPPKAVALALAELNRTPEHRARYRLAVDDREGAAPPREGSILFRTGSSHCFRAADGINFLRFGPDDEPVSLIHVGSVQAGAAFYNVVGTQPVYDLRWYELSAADARQLAAVLWWLDRVRSRARSRREEDILESMSYSTADGSGTIQLLAVPAASRPLRLSGTLWSGGVNNLNSVADRWTANYRPETALNLAMHLLAEALPDRLGREWSRFDPHEETYLDFGVTEQTPRYAPDELTRLHDLAVRALSILPQGQVKMSYALLGEIVVMVGDLGFDDLAPTLRKLAGQLPPAAPGRAGRTADTIWQEMHAAEVPFPPLVPGLPPPASPDDEVRHARWEELSREWEGVIDGTDEPGAAETLRGYIRTALDQLAAVRNPEALAASAADPKSASALWALQQLRRLKENARAAAVLEGWLKRADTPTAARQVFAALLEVAPERARQVALAVPADASGHPLFVPAFVLLAKKGAPIPQEPLRRRGLLAIVVDPKREYGERADAIRALVPDENPGRYPDAEINASLRRLLDKPALRTQNGYPDDYLASVACSALAERGNGGDFDRILAHLTGPTYADTTLEALVRLLPRRGEKGRRKLGIFLRRQLTRQTNLPVGSLVRAAWLAGLRDLRPEIRRLATAGPEELESERADRYGGDPAPLAGERFHIARQVAALWEDEASAVARVKALIAFGTHDNVTCAPERSARFTEELRRLAPALGAAERAAVGIFLESALKTMAKEDVPAQTPDGEPEENTLGALVRTALGL